MSRRFNFRVSPYITWSKRELKLRLGKIGWEQRVWSNYSDTLNLSSNKLSLSVIIAPKECWIGFRIKNADAFDKLVAISPLPCVQIQFHRVETWGGIIP